ncbi:MAG TPA: Rrf2 family transcriptional regulator [Dongiaceae bacterium]|jgi:Rrf2 family protein|nr:Rrf2 family transcriptional regulator [Dongiaceae bacterium]
MLSQKAKYALRALQALARAEQGQPCQIADIAKHQHVPRKFLELILVDLKRAGLVRSIRGRHGGYQLAKPAREIRYGMVIRLIDGPLANVACASQTAYRPCKDCQDEKTCSIHRLMCQVREQVATILDNATLADNP